MRPAVGLILLVRSSLEIVCQFASVLFRFRENAYQYMPRHQILVTDLANQGAVSLDLLPFKHQILCNHFGQGRTLLRHDTCSCSFRSNFFWIVDRHTSKLLHTLCQAVGMIEFLGCVRLELSL